MYDYPYDLHLNLYFKSLCLCVGKRGFVLSMTDDELSLKISIINNFSRIPFLFVLLTIICIRMDSMREIPNKNYDNVDDDYNYDYYNLVCV